MSHRWLASHGDSGLPRAAGAWTRRCLDTAALHVLLQVRRACVIDMRTCMRTYTHADIRTRGHTHTHTLANSCVRACVHTCRHADMQTCAYSCVCIHARIDSYMHMYTHNPCMHACMHAHTRASHDCGGAGCWVRLPGPPTTEAWQEAVYSTTESLRVSPNDQIPGSACGGSLVLLQRWTPALCTRVRYVV